MNKITLLCCLLLSLFTWIGCDEINNMPTPNNPTQPLIGTVIDIQEMPNEIQTYITTHFPEQHIVAVFYKEHPPHPQNGNRPQNENDSENQQDHNQPNHDDNHHDEPYNHDDENNHPTTPCGSDTPENTNNGIYQVHLDNGTTLFFDENGNLVYTEQQGGEWWEHDNDQNEIAIAYDQLPESIILYIENNHPNHFIIKAEIEPDGNYEIRLNNGLKLYFDIDGNIIDQENEFALRLSSINMPDSAAIGQTITVTGYIVNESIYPFSGNTLRIVYAIENEMPSSFIDLSPDAQPFDSDIDIAPNDSIPFGFDIEIEPNSFAIGYDIAIIWPDVITSINPVFTNNPAITRGLIINP